jgi:hypothetical protein
VGYTDIRREISSHEPQDGYTNRRAGSRAISKPFIFQNREIRLITTIITTEIHNIGIYTAAKNQKMVTLARFDPMATHAWNQAHP